MKKIKVYFLKAYLFTTTAYKDIDELKSDLIAELGEYIRTAGKLHRVSNIKNYQFEIVH